MTLPPAVPPAAAGCLRPTRPSSAGSSGPFSGSSQKPPSAQRSPDDAEADSPGFIHCSEANSLHRPAAFAVHLLPVCIDPGPVLGDRMGCPSSSALLSPRVQDVPPLLLLPGC